MPVLVDLKAAGVKYSIATTSGKPRVPVCVDAASLWPFFPPDKIHSGGESIRQAGRQAGNQAATVFAHQID